MTEPRIGGGLEVAWNPSWLSDPGLRAAITELREGYSRVKNERVRERMLELAESEAARRGIREEEV